MRKHRKLTAISVLAAVIGLAPLARAGAGTELVSPGANGTVDFGDQIRYDLTGVGCQGDSVRVIVTTTTDVLGTASIPAADPVHPGHCVGLAAVPSERDVRDSGWRSSDPIAIRLQSNNDSIPLRYERFEVEYGALPEGKTPMTATVADPRAEEGDRVVELATGDAIGLGSVDLTNVESISLRICTPTPKPHLTPSFVELRQDRADGPVVLGPVDVSSSYAFGDPQTKSNFGWPNCWWLQPWPIENPTLGDGATELFLVMAATATPVQISYIDFNGSGAKDASIEPEDPADMQAMPLDAEHWSATGCVFEEGTARNAGDTSPTGYLPEFTGGLVGPQGCTLDYTATQLNNVVVRFDVKFGAFADNGGVYVGGREIQLRQAGEFLTGGLFGDAITAANDWAAPDELDPVMDFSGGGYPAQRLNVNSYDDWNHFEVVQVGARHIVRVNGRTVADSDTTWPQPSPYTFGVSSQPQFGYDYSISFRYDNRQSPAISEPSGWSNLVWRNFRYYQCTSPADPVCTGGPGMNG